MVGHALLANENWEMHVFIKGVGINVSRRNAFIHARSCSGIFFPGRLAGMLHVNRHGKELVTWIFIILILLSHLPAECSSGFLRLVNDQTDDENMGRVEICRNGIWGRVCSLGWGNTDGEIACAQLGYVRTGETENEWAKPFRRFFYLQELKLSRMAGLGRELVLWTL